MKRPRIIFAAVVVVTMLAYLGLKNHGKTAVRKQTRFLMDTYVTIQAPDGNGAQQALEKAMDRIEKIDVKFNALNTNSPIYRFNNGNPAIDDPEIVALVTTANEVSRQTEGAFDITVYPLMELWGFYEQNPAVPSGEDITNCLVRIGWQNLEIHNGTLTKLRNDVKIDLGGIAKGYAVGEAMEVLKEEGVASALIDAGGDIYALGLVNGRPWKIGIRRPPGEGIMGVLDMADLAIVTSGDYERFFEKDGVRYHHILDPRTGYPSRGIRSVTIISEDTTLADAFSTALFVLGAEKGMAVAQSHGAFEALMITDDRQAVMSPGLSGKLDLRGLEH